MLDVERLRADTPGVADLVHLNNAGAALSPEPVLDAVISHLRLEARIGGYEAAAEAEPGIRATYRAVADLLGARAREIALMESATAAWTMAFLSIPFRPGDRILTGVGEYGSNYLTYLHVAQHLGLRVEVVPDDEHGQLDVSALERMLDDDVRLVSISHIPTNGGLVNPAAAVGAVVRDTDAYYLLDACQTAGQRPIDVRAIGCDMLSFTGRKYVRGPRGTGALYVRHELLDELRPVAVDLYSAAWTSPTTYAMRPDTRRYEFWENSIANRLGLGTAVRYALDVGMDAIAARVDALGAQLRAELAEVRGVTVRDKGVDRCGIVTFTVDGHDAGDLSDALRARRINTSVTAAGSTLLDMEARGLDRMVRASVHAYNTEDELRRLVREVAALTA